MRSRLLGCVVAALLGYAATAAERPLTVVIVIDQLRPDYLERFSPFFTSRGFKRLLSEGAVYTNARLEWGNAETAPGHATIGTGLLPSQHGIIGNRWFARDAPVDEKLWSWYFDDVYAYRERELAPLSPEQQWWRQGGSPQHASAVDVQAPPRTSRTIAVSHKDTSAILMASGAKAYYFDYRLPGFVPATDFNRYVPGYIPASQQWTASTTGLEKVTFDPPAAWPLKNTRYGGTFPHPVPDARAVVFSPFGHAMLFDFALHVLYSEQPDQLFVSVSSTDNLGHYYGPDSMEVADSMIRLDRALADFLDALERYAGGELRVTLTSDHGIQPIPEITRLRDPQADAGRIDLRNPDPNARTIGDLPPVRVELERGLARAFSLRFDESMPLRNALVYFFEGTGLYLNWRRIAELKLDSERVKRELVRLLERQQGVAHAWTARDLPALMRASYREGRSGDVLVALRPGWIWHWGSNSTTHGQPVDDDLRVPLIRWGKGIAAGRHEEAVSIRYPSATP